ncbi:hypothetical protein YC2023_116987 [Brassica napus]
MVEDDEQYGSGELIRVDKADISDPTSASIDGMTSASTDGTTSASTDGKTSTSINSTTSTLTNATTSTSIDVEEELIEERTYMSKASHLAVPKHQRPPIWTEEAVEFHKRVKRIHDPVKIVVPCAVSEVEFPIPPDKGAHLNSYIEVLDDHQHIEASQRGLRFRDEVDKGLAEAASIDSDQIPSNDTTYAISNDMNKPASIDATTSPSIDTGHVSEQKEFNVSYARFTEKWLVCLARGSCRGDEGLSIDGAPLPSIDGAPLPSIDGDARTWAKLISRPTEAQKPHKVTKILMDDQKPYLCVF